MWNQIIWISGSTELQMWSEPCSNHVKTSTSHRMACRKRPLLCPLESTGGHLDNYVLVISRGSTGFSGYALLRYFYGPWKRDTASTTLERLFRGYRLGQMLFIWCLEDLWGAEFEGAKSSDRWAQPVLLIIDRMPSFQLDSFLIWPPSVCFTFHACLTTTVSISLRVHSSAFSTHQSWTELGFICFWN